MKILLGMSGGLDSTYSASMMKTQGHDVLGAVLKMHEYTDVESAVKSAREAEVPIVVIDCTERFRNSVEKYFAQEYLVGRTPNPCIMCNETVKFRTLYEYAAENGFDRIATGHYAKIVNCDGRYAVCMADDKHKDQSYVLWRLGQDVLSKLYFPLGESEKSEVRKRAESLNLSAAEAKESQEICFIPGGDYAGFIEKNYGKSPMGNFVDEDGKVLGSHEGIIHYTVGQRKGLGIALGKRMFISEIRADKNEIVLSENLHADKACVFISNIVFSGAEYNAGDTVELFVKLRYLAKPVPAVVNFLSKNSVVATIKDVNCAVTPGQSAVFYNGEKVIFGGFIDRVTV